MDLLKDNPKQLFFRYLIPSIGGTLVYTIYSLIDMIAIGHGVGPLGTAATAVILPLFQIPSFISILCGIGGSVLLSTAKGKGNESEQNNWFSVSSISVLILSILALVFFWISRVKIMTFFGADETILPYALEYGNMIILGFPFFTIAGYLPFILRNDSDPDLPLLASIIGGIINMFGDWLLVFPLSMGMFGAGLATLVGSMVQCIVLSTHFSKKKGTIQLIKPKAFRSSFKKMLPYGFGSSFMEISTVISTIVMNKVIMKYSGTDALTVYGFMLTIVALFQYIFLGIGQAAQPIISQNYGAGFEKRVRTIELINLKTTLAFSMVFIGFGHLFPGLITRIFVEETPSIAAIAPKIIRTYLISIPFLAFNTSTILNLQSESDDKPANLITLLRGVILNSILIITLPAVIGPSGIWWGVVFSEALVCFVSGMIWF